MRRWDIRRGGGHWCLAAASIAAAVTVTQVPGLWAFPDQWGVVRVCVGRSLGVRCLIPMGLVLTPRWGIGIMGNNA